MTLLRSLISRFGAMLGDIYYEGTVPANAPYPYSVLSVKIPASFGASGEVQLTCYERGGNSHTRMAENLARRTRLSGELLRYDGGLALLQAPKCVLSHEKGGIAALRLTIPFTHYPNQPYSLRKEEFPC